MIAFLRSAQALAQDPQVKRRLLELEPAFVTYDREEATFIERINANKAARGEKPTRLSARRKIELSEYAQDADGIEAEAVRLASDSGDPVQVIRTVLRSSLADLRFWEDGLKYYHPADRPIGQERIEVRRRLIAALREFLATLPTPELPDQGPEII